MMSRWKQVVTVGASALLLAMMAQAATPRTAEVKVESGALRGVVSQGVAAFKGIPFAAPPVGDLRWRPPQPVHPWSGVRSAAAYGHDCMQLPFPGDAAPLRTQPSEDCLYLNVWTPAQHQGKKLPVLVWIYGGGFVNGGTSPAVYDGTHFAERGVVLVSFNYRLGRFGFFAFPALSAEHPDEPLGNYAFMDQIAALRWVQRNIAAFGGDPANVTIFGESAGGMSVNALMTSPQARGLFAKAVVESGGGRNNLLSMSRLHDSGPSGTPSAEQVGVNFAKSMGIEGDGPQALAALRKLPADKIVDGMNMASMSRTTYTGPMIDGRIMVETPEQAYRAGHEARVPFMVGANSADLGFFFGHSMEQALAPFAPNQAEARKLFDPGNTGNVRQVGTRIAADEMMIEPARFVARSLAAAGEPTFEFRFSYVAESMRSKWPGAPHASEIPYVFDTIRAHYGKDVTEADEATAHAAIAYWVAFARYGTPDAAGEPRWPDYNSGSDVLMNFTTHGPVAEPDPLRPALDMVEGLVQMASR